MKKTFGPKFGPKGPKPGPNYDNFHIILRLFDVLQNFPITQVKRCAIITWYIRVPSRVAERIKT